MHSVISEMSRRYQNTALIVPMAMGLAIILGWGLAWERWTIIGAVMLLMAIPIAIRWPIVTTFGLYALVVPFDAVASLFETGGTTLTKLLGAFAGATLLLVGIAENRLSKPPRAAVWFGLFVIWAVLSAGWAVDAEIVFKYILSMVSMFLLYVVAVCIR